MKTSKDCLLLVFLSVFVFFSSCKSGMERKSEPFATFTLQKGVNISHWLSQSQRRGQERVAFFTQKDIQIIDSLGFDHIRLPVDEEQLWDESGAKIQSAFSLLHEAMKWSEEAGLRVVLDLHIIRSHHFNRDPKPLWTDPAEQDKLISLWNDLSDELKGYSREFLAYELMNEAVADDPEDWNRLIDRLHAAIRELEPNRILIIGSNRWQSTDTFHQLKVPENDTNIYLSFHFYKPMVLTHYGASWTPVGRYTGSVQYPGRLVPQETVDTLPAELAAFVRPGDGYFDINSMRDLLKEPISYAKELGLPLYCGEWGCLVSGGHQYMLKWYADFRQVLEENNIAWANWDYRGGFGILDRERNLKQPLIDVLLK